VDDVDKLKGADLVNYALTRAKRIAAATKGEDWDDTEDWLVDAAELAYAFVKLHSEGYIRDADATGGL
jgi:hypothetical protein